MRSPHRRCRQCQRRFRPHPQTAYKQKTCSRRACQRRRHLQGCRVDHKKNPQRDGKRRQKIRAWAMAFQHYWRHYRARHPAYRERERRRMARKRRRLRSVAKREEWRTIAVEKLNAIAAQTPKRVAKRDECDRRVGGLVDFLFWKEGVAKPEVSPVVLSRPHNSGHGQPAMGGHPPPL